MFGKKKEKPEEKTPEELARIETIRRRCVVVLIVLAVLLLVYFIVQMVLVINK